MKKHDLKKWKNNWISKPIFIIGNGHSLKQYNLSVLEGYFTIGINRAFLKIDPTILLWQDIELWDSEKEIILESKSIKVCTKKSDPDNLFSHFELIEHIKTSKKVVNYHFGTSPESLYRFANSGILGVQLAITLGASPIVLLGMDGNYDNVETNFYGKNKGHNERTLDNFMIALKFLKQNGRTPIYNCSDNGLWKKYESLEEVIKKINPKKYSRDCIIKILDKMKRI
jgi:hypothetical protein